MASVNFGNGFRNFENNYSLYNSRNCSKTENNQAVFPQNTFVKQKKVSFVEGTKLILKGVKDKAVDIVKSIVKHPFKTLAIMAGTTLALAALPLLGISMATGGAALVVGFGALAIYGTIKNILAASKNSKNGNFDEMRKNLHNIGGNIIDLALTLPFMPKALKHLKRNVPLYFQRDIRVFVNPDGTNPAKLRKFFGGTAEYYYNSDGTLSKISNKRSLLSEIKQAKTWKEKYNILLRQDRTEAMYEQINKAYRDVARERGLYSARDLKFRYIPEEVRALRDGSSYAQNESIVYGGVRSNLESFNANRIDVNTNASIKKLIETIGHEHRHVEQNEMMVRAGFIDKKSNFAHSFFADSLKKGKIEAGTPEYIKAQKFNEARLNYPKNPSGSNPEYVNNLLEVDARAVGETEVANQIKTKLYANLGYKEGPVLNVKYNPIKDIVLSNGIIINKSAKS